MAEVSIIFGAEQVAGWQSYVISLDMLQPADAVTFTLGPVTKELYDLSEGDTPITVWMGSTKLFTGYRDDRDMNDEKNSGSSLMIRGRDKVGRMVDESMPLMSFKGLGIVQLAEHAAGPWFDKIILSNAENRRLIRGSKRVAGVSSEPEIHSKAHAARKVTPGSSRWSTLDKFLSEAHLMAWSTADGESLVIGLPNYKQKHQYKFFMPERGSSRRSIGNVINVNIKDSVAERYSKIIAMGCGKGSTQNYGPRVTKHRGSVVDGPGVDGIGNDFQARKIMFLADDDVTSADDAVVHAAREMALRDSAGAKNVTITVEGHSQIVGGEAVLFAFDTMCSFEHEKTGTKGSYLITSVEFRAVKGEGTTTVLNLVPKGSVFV